MAETIRDDSIQVNQPVPFIARLCAHVRVNTLIPGSILQTAPGDYVILGRVAQDIEIHMT